MYIRNILPYIKKSFCWGIILGTAVCTLGISNAKAGICFLPNGEECQSEFSISSDSCKNWSDAEREKSCSAKNGYVKQSQVSAKENDGFNCESAVRALGDVCCPGWYYCTEENCQDRGFKDTERKTPENAYVCDECTQGGKTYYKCKAKPCNYDAYNPGASTLEDACENENAGSVYCVSKYENCRYDETTKQVFEWVADDERRSGKQKCGTCVEVTTPPTRCENAVWEENLPNGCVTCTKTGEVNGKSYYCCEDITEYPVPEANRDLTDGACHQYEGPVQASGRDAIKCYKEVEKDCGNDNQYLTSSAEGCYCRDYVYDFDAIPEVLNFNAAGEAPETGDTVDVTSTRAHQDGSNVQFNKYAILDNNVLAETGCQLLDDEVGTIKVSCRKNEVIGKGSSSEFVVRHVHTVTQLHPELSKKITINVEGDKCPDGLAIDPVTECAPGSKGKVTETKSISGAHPCFECLNDSCPDETWTKCEEEGKDCRPNPEGYEAKQTEYGNYCIKAKACEENTVTSNERTSGEGCYVEAGRSGDDICWKHKDPLEECSIDEGKVWDEETCGCIDATCEDGFSVDAQKAEDCGEHPEGYTFTLGTNPAKSGDKLCTKCEPNECSDEFTELNVKDGNWNCTSEGHICYEGDTAKYNCTCDLEDADCGEGKIINKETCECEVHTCTEGSVTPTPGCYTCEATGEKSIDEEGNVADCLKCEAIEGYIEEANKQETKCYEEEVKEGADGTKCYKELEECPNPCPEGVDCVGPNEPNKPQCFNAIWGADAEGTNMWTTPDGNTYYKTVPVNPCTENNGNLLYKGEGYLFNSENCSCSIAQCPTDQGYYDVAPSGCFECETETVEGKECLKCQEIADVVPESEVDVTKCYEEEVKEGADGTKCFKEVGCTPNPDIVSDEPVCFKAVWGDKEGRYEHGEIVDGTWAQANGEKYFKEVPENPCTSTEDGIKLDPKGGLYTKWDKTTCQCLPNPDTCPDGTFDSEEKCQEGEGCFTCEKRTSEDDVKFGNLTCYERVDMENYRTAEAWTEDKFCYDEASKKDSANKDACYLKGDCMCPEGTTKDKPACFDEYAAENNLVADESRADGVLCYPNDEPKCDDDAVFDYDKCECVYSSCLEGIEFDGTPGGCSECKATGQVLSDGKACWKCDKPEDGFTEEEIEGDCVVSEGFKKLDENGATVATTTCYKVGEEDVTDAECIIKVLTDKIDGNTASIAFEKYIRATMQCEVEGSAARTEDIKIGEGSIAVGQLDLCQNGKISFKDTGTYEGKTYTCLVDEDFAPDCPVPCEDVCPDDEKPATELDDLTGWKATEHKACNGTDLTPTVQCYAPDNGPCEDLTPEDEIEGCVKCTYVTSCGGVRHYKCEPMEGYVNKSNEEVSLGWECISVAVNGNMVAESCCKPKDCPADTTKLGDYTANPVSGNTCTTYQSTNPQTFSGDDECFAKVETNMCPNNGDAYVSEAAAKTACGGEVKAIGNSYDCEGTTYTCYKCFTDTDALCKDYNENYTANCTEGCLTDGKTLRACTDVSDKTDGIKCFEVNDIECTEGEKCDGSSNKCEPVLSDKCDAVFDGWPFAEEYEVGTFGGCTTADCFNCMLTGQQIRTSDGSIKDCYARTKNPENGLSTGDGNNTFCAVKKKFRALSRTIDEEFYCHKQGKIVDYPMCFIENINPKLEKITTSTKDVYYDRVVRVMRQCEEDASADRGQHLLEFTDAYVAQREANIHFNFPGFADVCEKQDGKMYFSIKDKTTYNGKQWDCEIQAEKRVECPRKCSDYKDEAGNALLNQKECTEGCTGNVHTTCTPKSPISGLNCFIKTVEECSNGCDEEGQGCNAKPSTFDVCEANDYYEKLELCQEHDGCDGNNLKTCKEVKVGDTTCYDIETTSCTNGCFNSACINPEVDCPKRGEYASEAACKANLGTGCNGNKPVTCTDNTVDGLTCYKMTVGEECTNGCDNGKCSECAHGKAPQGFACCETAGYGTGWSTEAACKANNHVEACEQVPYVPGSVPPTAGCWIPSAGCKPSKDCSSYTIATSPFNGKCSSCNDGCDKTTYKCDQGTYYFVEGQNGGYCFDSANKCAMLNYSNCTQSNNGMYVDKASDCPSGTTAIATSPMFTTQIFDGKPFKNLTCYHCEGNTISCPNGTSSTTGKCCMGGTYGTLEACKKAYPGKENCTFGQVPANDPYSAGCWVFQSCNIPEPDGPGSEPDGSGSQTVTNDAWLYCYYTGNSSSAGSSDKYHCITHLPSCLSEVKLSHNGSEVIRGNGEFDRTSTTIGYSGDKCEFIDGTEVVKTDTWLGDRRPTGYTGTQHDWYCGVNITCGKSAPKSNGSTSCTSPYEEFTGDEVDFLQDYLHYGAEQLDADEDKVDWQTCETYGLEECGFKLVYNNETVNGHKCAKIELTSCPTGSSTAYHDDRNGCKSGYVSAGVSGTKNCCKPRSAGGGQQQEVCGCDCSDYGSQSGSYTQQDVSNGTVPGGGGTGIGWGHCYGDYDNCSFCRADGSCQCWRVN